MPTNNSVRKNCNVSIDLVFLVYICVTWRYISHLSSSPVSDQQCLLSDFYQNTWQLSICTNENWICLPKFGFNFVFEVAFQFFWVQSCIFYMASFYSLISPLKFLHSRLNIITCSALSYFSIFYNRKDEWCIYSSWLGQTAGWLWRTGFLTFG